MAAKRSLLNYFCPVGASNSKRSRQSSDSDTDSSNSMGCGSIENSEHLDGISVSQGASVSTEPATQTVQTNQPPSDISLTPDSHPVQPINISYLVTTIAGKKRSFNPEWYKKYTWLECSVERNAVYCCACRFYGSGAVCRSRPELKFTTTGFSNWKHATGTTGALAKHSNSVSHKESILIWQQSVQNASQNRSITDRLHSSRQELVQKNHHYLTGVIDVLLLCCYQEIATRGHDESRTSHNRGNFVEILQLIGKHDPVIGERLNNGPRNAMYTSPQIQIMLLGVMADLVQKKGCSSVKKLAISRS